jgi:hypothetical protein
MGNKPLNRIKVMLGERMMTNKDLAEKLGKNDSYSLEECIIHDACYSDLCL